MKNSLIHLYICQVALTRLAACHADPGRTPRRGATLSVRGGHTIALLSLLPLARGPVPPWSAGSGAPRGQAAGISLSLVPAALGF